MLILLVAASAILPGIEAAGKPAGASDSRSPYSTEDVVSARESGRFTLDFVMKAAADGSGGVIEDWIRAGGSVDDRDAKAPHRGQTTESPVSALAVPACTSWASAAGCGLLPHIREEPRSHSAFLIGRRCGRHTVASFYHPGAEHHAHGGQVSK